MKVFDSQTIQSTGAFLQGELERLDPQLYEPIADFTWSRDMPLREDVTIADEVTSFVLSNYAGGFGGMGSGKSFLLGGSTTLATTSVSATKVVSPVTPWGMEVSYNIFELEKAQKAGRPIDVQKFDALKLKHQLDIDMMVYLGDDQVGVKGLLNAEGTVEKASLGSYDANSATQEQTLDFFNGLLNAAWKQTQYTRIPNTLLVTPSLFGALASKQLTNTSMNLLQFVKQNNIAAQNGIQLDIRPVKWLANGAVSSGQGRVVAYTMARDVVRFPLVQLQSMPVQFRGLEQAVPYYGALGAVEFVRPEMVMYADYTAS